MTPEAIPTDDVVAATHQAGGEESLAVSSEMAKLSLVEDKGESAAPDVTDAAKAEDDEGEENRDDDRSITEKKEDESSAVDASNKDGQQNANDNNKNTKTLHRSSSNSSSFIRAHDLEVPKELQKGGRHVSSTRLHESMKAQGGFRGPPQTATEGLFFLDHDLKLILDSLVQLAYSEATDESARFTPGRETARALKERATPGMGQPVPVDDSWPIRPWHAANPKHMQEILVFNGMVASHNKGFGHDWPIVKARGIIPTSPRELAEFLWKSENVPKYNNMSQGREDGTIFQEGFDTRAEDSPYGIPGCAKILKSYNKVKMLPRTMEIISVLHVRPLEPPLAPSGTYLMVSRSLWESDNLSEEAAANFVPPASIIEATLVPTPAPTPAPATSLWGGVANRASSAVANKVGGAVANKVVRTEMFLSVNLLRPIGENGQHCEMTNIAHALAPGLNKTVAKTAANVSAVKIVRDLQALYLNNNK